MRKCNVQIVSVGTVGIKVLLCQREGGGGRKDYALLNAEQMVYISFVINAFKFFFMLLMLIKCFCVYIFY